MTLKNLVDTLTESATITIQEIEKEETTLINLTKGDVLNLKEETLSKQIYLSKITEYGKCLIILT